MLTPTPPYRTTKRAAHSVLTSPLGFASQVPKSQGRGCNYRMSFSKRHSSSFRDLDKLHRPYCPTNHNSTLPLASEMSENKMWEHSEFCACWTFGKKKRETLTCNDIPTTNKPLHTPPVCGVQMARRKPPVLPLPRYRTCAVDAVSNTTVFNTVHFCCILQAEGF